VPFPILDPASFRVPVGAWLSRVVGPGLRLTATVLAHAVRGRRDPRAVEAAVRALNLATASLRAQRIAFNVRARWYLDVMDYSALHNLKAAIFRPFGMGLACWPYHQLETPGSGLSYLGYDLFLSGGPYQHREYGATWNPGMQAVSVGQLRNDRRLAYGPRLNRQYAERVDQRLRAGERMAVLFAGNDDPGFRAGGETLFRVTVSVFAGRPGWFLVIKPKKAERPDGVLSHMCRDPAIAGLLAKDNVVLLPCDAENPEVCPSAWLIERMNLGAALPGSVHWEGLARGKRMIAYFPVNQRTPALGALIKDGLLHETADSFRRALEAAADRPDSVAVPTDRIRADFDVFGDDKALSRIADALFGEPGESASMSDVGAYGMRDLRRAAR
jgi:hypothetical protein